MNPYLGSYELTPPEIAEQLIINGFSPCPLEPMSKAITIKNWTKKEFNPNQFTQMNGVGIKTGNGLVAIDIDIYDPKISDEINKLNDLKVRGILTEEEYIKAKKKLLD